MQTIQKSTDHLRDEHRRLVRDISGALGQLQDAIEAEKLFRRRIHKDEPEFDANLPGLKFNMFIQLCKKESCKEYDYITKWRRDVIARGLLRDEA